MLSIFKKRGCFILITLFCQQQKSFKEDLEPSPIISFPYLNIEVYAKKEYIKKSHLLFQRLLYMKQKLPVGIRLLQVTDLVKNQGVLIDPKTGEEIKPKLNKSKDQVYPRL